MLESVLTIIVETPWVFGHFDVQGPFQHGASDLGQQSAVAEQGGGS
ncbi:hypothetical protein H1D24_32715 [Streptomyces sp. PSKA28]|uniref:Uncharacterized protein n=1 Tax=Streptomyces himalayensis subsp. himalayensis TaxID=2756131 RepID=A0A7W0DSF7_9ACTN|nr:hypothetical protein [Streptomyces himalayensis]MBA2950425.1 hypothetical protein [Streptomyces himalayensis subsp. himalayensis]